MHCHEVEPQLVAWHDGELGPSATQQVEEHLQTCAHCVDRSQRLLDATPQPWVRPPSDVQRRLEEAVDVDLVLTHARVRGPLPSGRRLPRWLTEPREVHPLALMAYAALLAMSLGWGLANWTNPATGGVTPSGDSADAMANGRPHAPAADVIPADAYAPASYQPDDKAGHLQVDGQQD